jgi:hypothetical protein
MPRVLGGLGKADKPGEPTVEIPPAATTSFPVQCELMEGDSLLLPAR